MAIVGVDVDSTLYDFETPSRDACFDMWEETGDESYKEAAHHPWTEWRSPADVLGLEKWLKVIGKVHEDDSILGMQPFTGAVETCQALMKAGHKLIYITNRAAHTEDATRLWLVKNGFFHSEPLDTYLDVSSVDGNPLATLVVTEGDKRPFLKDAQFLIDDRLKTCVQFVYDYDWQFYYGERGVVKTPANKDRLAFVKAYPYNQNATDVPGLILAPTWRAISQYLVKKGLLPQTEYTNA